VNFGKLETFVAGLPAGIRGRIKPVAAALAEHDGFLTFSGGGTAASAVAAEGVQVRSVAMDTVLGEPPTWIKMDIEGSEPAALRGAHRAIGASAPLLSICVYHSQHHVWSIPLQICAMRPDYRLYLRPFVPESWDLVCYAVPPHRSRP
jgi:hypothetical protein